MTPTSYLEILSMFAKMCRTKKAEIRGQRDRTKTGLDKVSALSVHVADTGRKRTLA